MTEEIFANILRNNVNRSVQFIDETENYKGVVAIKVSAFSPCNNAVGYNVYSRGYLVVGNQ
jgi:hypothetical protein